MLPPDRNEDHLLACTTKTFEFVAECLAAPGELLASAGPYKGPPRLTSSRLIPTIHLSKNNSTEELSRLLRNACDRVSDGIR